MHSQSHTIAAEQGWKFSESNPTYERLHLALLTGLFDNIGVRIEEADGKGREYFDACGIKFFSWSGLTIARKVGKQVAAGELVETNHLFGRTLACIEPEWVERVGAHLLRVSRSDPHWERRAG